MDLQKKIHQLFSTQRETWKLLDDNYNQFSNVKSKPLVWGSDIKVVIQHNPLGCFTALTNTDKNSIKKPKCSLCVDNRSDMQQGIPFLDRYMIL